MILCAATNDGWRHQGRLGRAPAGSRQVSKPADDCVQRGVLRLRKAMDLGNEKEIKTRAPDDPDLEPLWVNIGKH